MSAEEGEPYNYGTLAYWRAEAGDPNVSKERREEAERRLAYRGEDCEFPCKTYEEAERHMARRSIQFMMGHMFRIIRRGEHYHVYSDISWCNVGTHVTQYDEVVGEFTTGEALELYDAGLHF